MAVYPIMSVGKGGNTKHPMHSWNIEECVSKDREFYLTDEISESGKRYRLHARGAHCMDDFLPYVVLCPQMRQRNEMRWWSQDLKYTRLVRVQKMFELLRRKQKCIIALNTTENFGMPPEEDP